MDSTAKFPSKMLLTFLGGIVAGVITAIIVNKLFPAAGSTTTTATGGQVTTQPTATTVTTTQPVV